MSCHIGPIKNTEYEAIDDVEIGAWKLIQVSMCDIVDDSHRT